MDRSGKHYHFRLREHGEFQFHLGVVKHDDILGNAPGICLPTSLRKPVWAYRPRMHDFVMDMPRKSAIIYPKDVAFILIWADIFPGARVLEVGVGSGAVTIPLLRAIGSSGSLVTYDLRQDMIEHATKNVRTFLGETPNWTTRMRDVYEGIDDGPYDRIILDIPDPGRVAPQAATALVAGGMLCSYVPNITQVQASVEAYQESRLFSEIESFETVFRRWDFRGATARPARSMVSHTGFLTVARRGHPREPDAEGGAPEDV